MKLKLGKRVFDTSREHSRLSENGQKKFGRGMTEKRFVCVLEIEKRSVLSATANNAVTEKLFVPRANQTKKVGTLVQLELNFD